MPVDSVHPPAGGLAVRRWDTPVPPPDYDYDYENEYEDGE